jgi:outer membrane protein TolC
MLAVAGWVGVAPAVSAAATNAWLRQPLSLAETLDLALQQAPAIQKARKDLEAVHGVVVQTRAIALPTLGSTGSYQARDPEAVDTLTVPLLNTTLQAGNDQSWSVGVRLMQSIYEGGRMRSAWRASRLLREQSLLAYQTVVADALLQVRIAYYDILLAEQEIDVRDASVLLLEEEWKDAKRRRNAGTVPEFNVIRAEVQWATAKPPLIRARNALRNAKIRLANLLAFDLAPHLEEDLPLQLSGSLEAELGALLPLNTTLAEAIQRALAQRSELAVLRQAEGLRRESLVGARAGRLPSLQTFVGYEGRSGMFSHDLDHAVDGWTAGVQLRWDWYDGGLTSGRVTEAKARLERAQIELEDAAREVELEVRTAHSNYGDAREVLESQRKVQDQAQEALRLATARYQAGSGTQLDLLAAETSLTEARTTRVVAARDVLVARARLDRAIGPEFVPVPNPQP